MLRIQSILSGQCIEHLEWPLTCDEASGDVKLGDGAGEGAGGHPQAAEDSAHHHGWPATIPLHKHTAQGACVGTVHQASPS